MEENDKVQLTKEWILTMLYDTPKSLEELVNEGCRIMVFGWEYNEFISILSDMKSENTVNEINNIYHLTIKGIFEIKKYTLLPLLKLTESPSLVGEFVAAYKDKCDTKFVQLLASKNDEASKISEIKHFAKQNYDKIANIIHLFSSFAGN